MNCDPFGFWLMLRRRCSCCRGSKGGFIHCDDRDGLENASTSKASKSKSNAAGRLKIRRADHELERVCFVIYSKSICLFDAWHMPEECATGRRTKC